MFTPLRIWWRVGLQLSYALYLGLFNFASHLESLCFLFNNNVDFAETLSHHWKSHNLQICPKAHLLNHPPGPHSHSHSNSCSHAEVSHISAKEIPCAFARVCRGKVFCATFAAFLQATSKMYIVDQITYFLRQSLKKCTAQILLQSCMLNVFL